jgi:hypothetical protein
MLGQLSMYLASWGQTAQTCEDQTYSPSCTVYPVNGASQPPYLVTFDYTKAQHPNNKHFTTSPTKLDI